MGKRKKEDDTFMREKTEEKQNSATITITVDGKGTAFPVKLKLQGNSLNKNIKKESFMQSIPSSLQNSTCSFIFITLVVHTTTSTISTISSFLCFSQFLPPYFTLIYSQNHP